MKGSKIVDLVIVKLEEKSAFLTPQGANNPILVTGDNIDELKPVYSYIDAHIAEAANEVLLAAPLNRLAPISVDVKKLEPQTANSDGSGVIYASPDFLRLYTLQMDDWDRPVHKAITKTDHLYTLQHNKFTKGTPQKPVVVFSGVRGYYDEYILDDGTELLDDIVYTGTDIPDLNVNIGSNKQCVNIYKKGEVVCFTKVIKEGLTTYVPKVIDKTQIPFLEYYSVRGAHSIKEFSYIPHFRLSLDYNRDVAEAIALNCAKKVMEVFGNADGILLLEKELNTVLANMKL